MKFIFITSAALAFLTIASSCSDETSIPLCGCEPDEYCVDDECIATDGSVRPAPMIEKKTDEGN